MSSSITAKLAADMVAQQIALYDEEIQRLDENIKNLEARKEAVRLMRTALLPLIGPTKEQLPLIKIEPRDARIAPGNGTTASSTLPRTVVAPTPGVSGFAKTIHHPTSTGFAAAVRNVLRDYPKGIRPIAVAE